MVKTYLGVDVGTTGIKASIFDREGNLKSQSYVPSVRYHPAPGLTEQKPVEMLTETMRVIRDARGRRSQYSLWNLFPMHTGKFPSLS